jgi:hypothetical protein
VKAGWLTVRITAPPCVVTEDLIEMAAYLVAAGEPVSDAAW